MKNVDRARYFKNKPCSDDNVGKEMYFFSGIRGSAAFFAASNPTSDSRSGIACEKILRLVGGSFLNRPSLCDEAMDTLSDFANKSVFALQEAYKSFFANTAMLFVCKGKARAMLTGNSRVYYLSDGKAVQVCEERDHLLFGKGGRYKETFPAEFPLSGKVNAFAAVCGDGNASFSTAELESSYDGTSSAEEWAEKLSVLRSEEDKLSIMTVILPRREGLLAFFKKHEKNK